MSYQPIEKNIEISLEKILELMNPANYEIILPNHHLHERIFEVIKGDRQYEFNSTSIPPKGLQTHKEIQFNGKETVELKKTNLKLFSKGKDIFVNYISYNDNYTEKIFSGTISSFSTVNDLKTFNGNFLRMIIPCGNQKPFDINQFQRRYFITPHKKSPHFITINVSQEFHLYNYKLGEEHYLIIDCADPIELKEFQKKCFSILLSVAFIKGSLIHDECFILAFNESSMVEPNFLLYNSMRASIKTQQGVFTSNPFSVNSDIDFPRDKKGDIKENFRKKLYEDIIDFPEQVFSNMANLFYEKEKLQRAVLLYVQGHVASLEMRIPNYYVAIEAITGYISSELAPEKKSFSPIKDKNIASDLIAQIKETVRKLKKDNDINDDEFNLTIIEKNIDRLNAPPNADKLSESFKFLGIELTKEQKKLLNERNRFLHGSFLKTIDDDKAFRDALHCGLRLHFMIANLILKLSGFSGKIINYAELWSHITEKSLNEERLVKI